MAAVRIFLILFLLANLSLSHSISENEVLLKLKSLFTNAGALDGWVPGSSPCASRWVGVVCFGGNITGLHLSDMGLSGAISIEALQELVSLRTISFVNNSFTGPVPEFNKLGALKSLLLSWNMFSGEIPNDFFSSMSSLKKVWLNNNNFTGRIPESVLQMPALRELHLEGNQFSGPIPPLQRPKSVTSFDLSNNNLEGEIPESYSGFGASSFLGNDELCGKPLDKVCSDANPDANPEKPNQPSSSKNKVVAVIIVVVIICVVVTAIYGSKKNQGDLDDFSELDSESIREVEDPPRLSEVSSKTTESSKKGGGGSTKRGSHHNRNGVGDLVMVNTEKGSFGMADLMKAAAEVLGNGGLGSAYKAMMNNGLSVVVKRIREMNTLSRDEFDAEMRRFGRIKHKNILTPLAFHFRKEEKLIISEYIPKGSLLYIMHGDRGTSHAELTWPTRLKIIQGIARGLGYLHTHTEYSTYKLPHGDLKSSNVLLSSDYEPLLCDYALDPLTNPNHASQAMFGYKSPEYAQLQQVSPKSDVYCLGIIILEVITGKFPSQYLSNGKGGTDVVQWILQATSEGKEQELIDPEILNSTNSVDQIVQLLRIGAACTETNPTQRLDMKEAIRRIEEIHV